MTIRLLKVFVVVTLFTFWMLGISSCMHDPQFDPNVDPDPLDTLGGNPCDPDVIYFSKDILPIFLSNCAFSGCHDATSASDGVILDTYDNIISTGKVKPFDKSDSEIYEVMTEDDADDVMPPSGKLSDELIKKVGDWIDAGAKNEDCDDNTPCDTQDVSYKDYVKGVIATSCNGCHSAGLALGGVVTDSYSALQVLANDGRLFGAINWDTGYEPMPQGQDQLEKCSIDKIKSWIDAGAQNN